VTALPCCTPFYAASTFWHARTCSRAPNLKLDFIDRKALRTARMLERQVEQDPDRIEEAIPRITAWWDHVPECRCSDCLYVDANLDRDD
jgi:hypothetical protein